MHHLADSHMNAFIRLKLGITETNPTIKPYEEQTWAETPDSRDAPIACSMSIIEGLRHLGAWWREQRGMNAAA